MSVLVAVYPCANGDKLEIHKDSDWYSSPTTYILDSKRLDSRQSISEYEARTVMHDERFLFCAVELSDHVPTVASGELTTGG